MKFLTLTSKVSHEKIMSDYKMLEWKMEELQKKVEEQSKEIFDLRWEVSSLRNLLNEDQGIGKEHALLNHVILRNLVYFVSKKDLMNFRLVCKKWNDVMLPRIRKEFNYHFRQYYGWLIIYLFIYAVLLMPRVLMGSSKQ